MTILKSRKFQSTLPVRERHPTMLFSEQNASFQSMLPTRERLVGDTTVTEAKEELERILSDYNLGYITARDKANAILWLLYEVLYYIRRGR